MQKLLLSVFLMGLTLGPTAVLGNETEAGDRHASSSRSATRRRSSSGASQRVPRHAWPST